GVVVDSAGDLYVTDRNNSAIRKVATIPTTAIDGTAIPAGAVTAYAGDGTVSTNDGIGASAHFNFPVGVAANSAAVFVADTGNSTIRKLVPNEDPKTHVVSGAVSTVAGAGNQLGSVDGTAGAARFRAPAGVAVDGAGNVYVADT